jgi:hypothetical protein
MMPRGCKLFLSLLIGDIRLLVVHTVCQIANFLFFNNLPTVSDCHFVKTSDRFSVYETGNDKTGQKRNVNREQ